MYLLALRLAELRGTLGRGARAPAGELRGAAAQGHEHARSPGTVDDIAERHADKPFFFYLGRHVGLPVCLEGALKLKEISYIPTEAYAAGR
jgi:glucosamine--fructose-6-phosphate aminotransferase (isomerizing)